MLFVQYTGSILLLCRFYCYINGKGMIEYMVCSNKTQYATVGKTWYISKEKMICCRGMANYSGRDQMQNIHHDEPKVQPCMMMKFSDTLCFLSCQSLSSNARLKHCDGMVPTFFSSEGMIDCCFLQLSSLLS